MGDLKRAGWVRNAAGEVVGWVTWDSEVYDASGGVVGYVDIAGHAYLGWYGGDTQLGYVNPGGQLDRYDFNTAIGRGLGVSKEDQRRKVGQWYCRPVGRVDTTDGIVTDVRGRVVGRVDPSRNYTKREDAMGAAALLLLLRYVSP